MTSWFSSNWCRFFNLSTLCCTAVFSARCCWSLPAVKRGNILGTGPCLMSSNGHFPVDACGVKPWILEIYANPTYNSVGVAATSILFSLSLTRLTAHSAKPFEVGWYGRVNMWLNPHLDNFSLNSLEANCGPLSDTKVVGNPVCSQNHPNETAKIF